MSFHYPSEHIAALFEKQTKDTRECGLTHRGRDKVAADTRWHLKCIFVTENIQISIKISLKFVPRVQFQYSSIGSDNGLAPAWWQAIIWNHDE